MGCDQTTMNDVSASERERNRTTPNRERPVTLATNFIETSPVKSIQKKEEKIKGQNYAQSHTDKTDLENALFQNNMLNKQVPTKLNAKNEQLMLENQEQEKSILARVQQEMFSLTLLEEDDADERERNIQEREFYYLSQKGHDIGLDSKIPKKLQTLPTKISSSLEDPVVKEMLEQHLRTVVQAHSQMHIVKSEDFICHFGIEIK